MRGQNKSREKRIDIDAQNARAQLPRHPTPWSLPPRCQPGAGRHARKNDAPRRSASPSASSYRADARRGGLRAGAMARLTPGWVRPSASAARTKLPASTTAASTPIPLTSRASNGMLMTPYHETNDTYAVASCCVHPHFCVRSGSGRINHAVESDMFAISGITGQVGGAAAQALLEAGHAVRAVLRDRRRLHPGRRKARRSPSLTSATSQP